MTGSASLPIVVILLMPMGLGMCSILWIEVELAHLCAMTRTWQMPKRRNSMSQERKWPSPVMAFFLAVLGRRLFRVLAKRPLWSLSSSEMMTMKKKNSTRLEMRQAVAMIWSNMASNSSSSDLKHT